VRKRQLQAKCSIASFVYYLFNGQAIIDAANIAANGNAWVIVVPHRHVRGCGGRWQPDAAHFAPENLAHVFLTKMAGQSASGDLDGTQ
jgi:hypothetical protein